MRKLSEYGDLIPSEDAEATRGTMALSVDRVLREIGQMGPYQIRTLVFFMFLFLPITFQTLVMVFVADNTAWKCSGAVPRNESSCLQANQSATKIYMSGTDDFRRRCKLDRDQWEFAGSLYEGPEETIVTSFNLVCDDGYLATLANSILYLGWAIGAMVLGTVADKYGRRSVLFPCTFFVIVITFAMAFSHTLWPIVICRCLIGFFLAGCFLSMFVLATELVGPEKRALAGTLVWFFFTGALMIMGLIAYFVRDWRTLCIICSAPWFFVMLFVKFIPESVRWLLVQGRKREAKAILENVAKLNKKPMPDEDLLVPTVVSNKGFLELFKTRKLAIISIILNYAWFVNGMVYYGLSLSSGEFGGSIYLNFILTSLVEIPGNYLVIHNCNRFGRRYTVVAHMIIAGLFTLIVAAIPAGTNNTGYIAGRVTGGTIGKLSITVSFNALYVFAAELFPTMIRNSGMGMVSVVSRLGAALSPFIVRLALVNSFLPYALMGAASFVAAAVCWFLPETKGKPTLEVMTDIGEGNGKDSPASPDAKPESVLLSPVAEEQKEEAGSPDPPA